MGSLKSNFLNNKALIWFILQGLFLGPYMIQNLQNFRDTIDINHINPILIEKRYLKDAKLAIEKSFIDAIDHSVNQGLIEKSKQDKVKIEEYKENIKKEMLEQISGLNQISFKEILQNFCKYINLEVTEDYLQSVVDSRNRLIHEGKFLCDSAEIKSRYKNKEKYPQFQDSEHEYYFLMNFIDKCFLKMLHYKGHYYKWERVHEIKKEELV